MSDQIPGARIRSPHLEGPAAPRNVADGPFHGTTGIPIKPAGGVPHSWIASFGQARKPREPVAGRDAATLCTRPIEHEPLASVCRFRQTQLEPVAHPTKSPDLSGPLVNLLAFLWLQVTEMAA